MKLQIENLKCGGCAATIKKGLLSIDGVSEVIVHVEDSIVEVSVIQEATQEVKEKLSKMGYPEVGDANTLLHKAKSFVSCATGKMNSES